MSFGAVPMAQGGRVPTAYQSQPLLSVLQGWSEPAEEAKKKLNGGMGRGKRLIVALFSIIG